MDITNVEEYEPLAKQRLPKMVYDYYASGAEDQWTLRENMNSFARIHLQHSGRWGCGEICRGLPLYELLVGSAVLQKLLLIQMTRIEAFINIQEEFR
ncbi:hypothetical protein AQUCO_02200223v1 [Aquilegia coerulea]|uniref:FMN-dependent dehydrogenase domain-containing protein n=1 Tax=Aquilegia coerulea TaxID=218851 RepID=A0A2G5DDN2_AQUCA|nr:hypothetical protein AQUCO_02200223v1 [Aquilegia coerulea]